MLHLIEMESTIGGGGGMTCIRLDIDNKFNPEGNIAQLYFIIRSHGTTIALVCTFSIRFLVL